MAAMLVPLVEGLESGRAAAMLVAGAVASELEVVVVGRQRAEKSGQQSPFASQSGQHWQVRLGS